MTLAILLFALSQAAEDDFDIESFPVVEQMPNPFQFADGTMVETESDWARRRNEMRDMLLRYQYGRVPPPAEVRVVDETDEDGYRAVTLGIGGNDEVTVRSRLYVPSGDSSPYPVVVRFGLDGGPAQMILERGFAFVCFEHRDLDPDTEGHDEVGPAQQAYPDYDWGSLAVWAWGACRVLDYLETLDTIDTERAVITGHSRTGKAALLAGVLDERWAIVVPNGSGCGGAAAYRQPSRGAETLRQITLEKRFKAWFHDDFGLFANRENRLPFDQHFMRALVAPRVVLNTDALGDTWANPAGTQLAWTAAQPVFDFLGVSENNLCHFREGGHDQLPKDVDVLLDVAAWKFEGDPLTRDFSTLPVPAIQGLSFRDRADIADAMSDRFFDETMGEAFVERYGDAGKKYLIDRLGNVDVPMELQGKTISYLGKYEDPETLEMIIAFFESNLGDSMDYGDFVATRFSLDAAGFIGTEEAIAFLVDLARHDYWRDLDVTLHAQDDDGDSIEHSKLVRTFQEWAIRGIAGASNQLALETLRHLRANEDFEHLWPQIEDWETTCIERMKRRQQSN